MPEATPAPPLRRRRGSRRRTLAASSLPRPRQSGAPVAAPGRVGCRGCRPMPSLRQPHPQAGHRRRGRAGAAPAGSHPPSCRARLPRADQHEAASHLLAAGPTPWPRGRCGTRRECPPPSSACRTTLAPRREPTPLPADIHHAYCFPCIAVSCSSNGILVPQAQCPLLRPPAPSVQIHGGAP
ncbi:unnamed protein product [Urochloa humidicola]